MFCGFESTWMFKFYSPEEGNRELRPSYYSGMDIGWCELGGYTNMFLYPNPFFAEHYRRSYYRVKMIDSKLEDDGSVLFRFSTNNGDKFIIEAYDEPWKFKVALPKEDGYMIYQVVTHKNKLK